MTVTNRVLKKILRDCRRAGESQSVSGKADTILFAFPFQEQHQNIAYRVFAPILKAGEVKTCCLIAEANRGLLEDISTSQIIGLAVPEDLQKQPLLSDSVNQQLRQYRVAVALDLNAEFHPYTAAAVLKSRAPRRIGFLAECSDHFFNIQISKKAADPIESSYRYMVGLIRDSGLLG
ncbi:MAG: hypothetical protein JXR87_05350 [Candidatus Marinimicrobia bacterium]|nr:hypothetical protein [Candidatus Neomarinimicrobiota bacterium]